MTVAPNLSLEQDLLRAHPVLISCDEVGRGALAGPVAVGAVAIDHARAQGPVPQGMRDSKLIPEKSRAMISDLAHDWVSASAVGWASASEIDDVGIMRALGLAALRAVGGLSGEGVDTSSAMILLDGNYDYISRVTDEKLRVRPQIKADRDCASVAAASVIAKVARDSLMVELSEQWPVYQWQRNKGYASTAHRAAITECGLSPYHRASWTIREPPALF